MKTVKVFFLLILVSSFFITPEATYAQNVGLSISPNEYVITTQPGKTVPLEFIVGNTADFQIVSLNMMPYIPTQRDGSIKLLPESSGLLTFSVENAEIELEEPFLLAPKTGEKINLLVHVPKHIEEGDYYYVLELTHETGRIPEGKISLTHKVHVLSHILITVTQDGTKESLLNVREFYVGKQAGSTLFDTFSNIPLEVVFQNTGKNSSSVSGSVNIKGLGFEKNLPIPTTRVLAHSQKHIKFPDSLFRKTFLVGKYTATLKFVTNNQVRIASQTFIVFPFRFIALLVAIATILFIVSRQFKNHKPKHHS